jgi:hypothetical protein
MPVVMRPHARPEFQIRISATDHVCAPCHTGSEITQPNRCKSRVSRPGMPLQSPSRLQTRSVDSELGEPTVTERRLAISTGFGAETCRTASMAATGSSEPDDRSADNDVVGARSNSRLGVDYTGLICRLHHPAIVIPARSSRRSDQIARGSCTPLRRCRRYRARARAGESASRITESPTAACAPLTSRER